MTPAVRVGQLWYTAPWRLKNHMRTRIVQVVAVTYDQIKVTVYYDSHPPAKVGRGALRTISVTRVRFTEKFHLYQDAP